MQNNKFNSFISRILKVSTAKQFVIKNVSDLITFCLRFIYSKIHQSQSNIQFKMLWKKIDLIISHNNFKYNKYSIILTRTLDRFVVRPWSNSVNYCNVSNGFLGVTLSIVTSLVFPLLPFSSSASLFLISSCVVDISTKVFITNFWNSEKWTF